MLPVPKWPREEGGFHRELKRQLSGAVYSQIDTPAGPVSFNRNGTAKNAKVVDWMSQVQKAAVARGFSGSGKSVCVSSSIKDPLFNKLLECLRSIGNSPTEHNRDSSRFSLLLNVSSSMEVTSVRFFLLETLRMTTVPKEPDLSADGRPDGVRRDYSSLIDDFLSDPQLEEGLSNCDTGELREDVLEVVSFLEGSRDITGLKFVKEPPGETKRPRFALTILASSLAERLCDIFNKSRAEQNEKNLLAGTSRTIIDLFGQETLQTGNRSSQLMFNYLNEEVRSLSLEKLRDSPLVAGRVVKKPECVSKELSFMRTLFSTISDFLVDKKVFQKTPGSVRNSSTCDSLVSRIKANCETKSIWHPELELDSMTLSFSLWHPVLDQLVDYKLDDFNDMCSQPSSTGPGKQVKSFLLSEIRCPALETRKLAEQILLCSDVLTCIRIIPAGRVIPPDDNFADSVDKIYSEESIDKQFDCLGLSYIKEWYMTDKKEFVLEKEAARNEKLAMSLMGVMQGSLFYCTSEVKFFCLVVASASNLCRVLSFSEIEDVAHSLCSSLSDDDVSSAVALILKLCPGTPEETIPDLLYAAADQVTTLHPAVKGALEEDEPKILSAEGPSASASLHPSALPDVLDNLVAYARKRVTREAALLSASDQKIRALSETLTHIEEKAAIVASEIAYNAKRGVIAVKESAEKELSTYRASAAAARQELKIAEESRQTLQDEVRTRMGSSPTHRSGRRRKTNELLGMIGDFCDSREDLLVQLTGLRAAHSELEARAEEGRDLLLKSEEAAEALRRDVNRLTKEAQEKVLRDGVVTRRVGTSVVVQYDDHGVSRSAVFFDRLRAFKERDEVKLSVVARIERGEIRSKATYMMLTKEHDDQADIKEAPYVLLATAEAVMSDESDVVEDAYAAVDAAAGIDSAGDRRQAEVDFLQDREGYEAIPRKTAAHGVKTNPDASKQAQAAALLGWDSTSDTAEPKATTKWAAGECPTDLVGAARSEAQPLDEDLESGFCAEPVQAAGELSDEECFGDGDGDDEDGVEREEVSFNFDEEVANFKSVLDAIEASLNLDPDFDEFTDEALERDDEEGPSAEATIEGMLNEMNDIDYDFDQDDHVDFTLKAACPNFEERFPESAKLPPFSYVQKKRELAEPIAGKFHFVIDGTTRVMRMHFRRGDKPCSMVVGHLTPKAPKHTLKSKSLHTEDLYTRFCCIVERLDVPASNLSFSGRIHSFVQFVIQQSFSPEFITKKDFSAVEVGKRDVLIVQCGHELRVEVKAGQTEERAYQTGKFSSDGRGEVNDIFANKSLIAGLLLSEERERETLKDCVAEDLGCYERFFREGFLQPEAKCAPSNESRHMEKCIELTRSLKLTGDPQADADAQQRRSALKDAFCRLLVEQDFKGEPLSCNRGTSSERRQVARALLEQACAVPSKEGEPPWRLASFGGGLVPHKVEFEDKQIGVSKGKLSSLHEVLPMPVSDKYRELFKRVKKESVEGRSEESDPAPVSPEGYKKEGDYKRTKYLTEATYRTIEDPEHMVKLMKDGFVTNRAGISLPKPEICGTRLDLGIPLLILNKSSEIRCQWVYSRLLPRVRNGRGCYFDQACGVGVIWEPITFQDVKVKLKDPRNSAIGGDTSFTKRVTSRVQIQFYTESCPGDLYGEDIVGRWSKAEVSGHEVFISPSIIMGVRDVAYNSFLYNLSQVLMTSLVNQSELMSSKKMMQTVETGKIDPRAGRNVRMLVWPLVVQVSKFTSICRRSTWKTSEYLGDVRFITLTAMGRKTGDPFGMIKALTKIDMMSTRAAETFEGTGLKVKAPEFRAPSATDQRLLCIYAMALRSDDFANSGTTPLLDLPFKVCTLEANWGIALNWHIRGEKHTYECVEKMVKLSVEEQSPEYVQSLSRHLDLEIDYINRFLRGGEDVDLSMRKLATPPSPMYSHVISAALTCHSEKRLKSIDHYSRKVKFSISDALTSQRMAHFKEGIDKSITVTGGVVHNEMRDFLTECGEDVCPFRLLSYQLGTTERTLRDKFDVKYRSRFHIHPKDQKGGNRDISQFSSYQRFPQMYAESILEALCDLIEEDQMTVKTSLKVKGIEEICASEMSKGAMFGSKDKSHFCGHHTVHQIGLNAMNIGAIAEGTGFVSASAILMCHRSREIYVPWTSLLYNPDTLELGRAPARARAGIVAGTYLETQFSGETKIAWLYEARKNMQQGIFAKSAAAMCTISAMGTIAALACIFPHYAHGLVKTTSDDQLDIIRGYNPESFYEGRKKLSGKKVRTGAVACQAEPKNYLSSTVQLIFFEALTFILAPMNMKENMRKLMILKKFGEFNNFVFGKNGVVSKETIEISQCLKPLSGLSFKENLVQVQAAARQSLAFGHSPDVVMIVSSAAKECIRNHYKLNHEEVKLLERTFQMHASFESILVDHSMDNKAFASELKKAFLDRYPEEKGGEASDADDEGSGKKSPHDPTIGEKFYEPDPVKSDSEDDFLDEDLSRYMSCFNRGKRRALRRDEYPFESRSYQVRRVSQSITNSMKISKNSTLNRFRFSTTKERKSQKNLFLSFLRKVLDVACGEDRTLPFRRDRGNYEVSGEFSYHKLTRKDLKATRISSHPDTRQRVDFKRAYHCHAHRFLFGRGPEYEELHVRHANPMKILWASEYQERRQAPASITIDCLSGRPRGRGMMVLDRPLRQPVAFSYWLETAFTKSHVDRQSMNLSHAGRHFKSKVVWIGGETLEWYDFTVDQFPDSKVVIPFARSDQNGGRCILFYQLPGDKDLVVRSVETGPENKSDKLIVASVEDGEDDIVVMCMQQPDYWDLPLVNKTARIPEVWKNFKGPPEFLFNLKNYSFSNNKDAITNLEMIYNKRGSSFPREIYRRLLPASDFYLTEGQVLESSWSYVVQAGSSGARLIHSKKTETTHRRFQLTGTNHEPLEDGSMSSYTWRELDIRSEAPPAAKIDRAVKGEAAKWMKTFAANRTKGSYIPSVTGNLVCSVCARRYLNPGSADNSRFRCLTKGCKGAAEPREDPARPGSSNMLPRGAAPPRSFHRTTARGVEWFSIEDDSD